MRGRRSRNKGARTKRAIARLLQAKGIAAVKISGMYKPGADPSMPLLGTDKVVEVKCRATGVTQLYNWLDERQEQSVVLRISLAAEIAKRAV
jgi:Holliday junction resolvase